jgi:hypothetical protein
MTTLRAETMLQSIRVDSKDDDTIVNLTVDFEVAKTEASKLALMIAAIELSTSWK